MSIGIRYMGVSRGPRKVVKKPDSFGLDFLLSLLLIVGFIMAALVICGLTSPVI